MEAAQHAAVGRWTRRWRRGLSGPRARGAIERRVLREDRILQAPQLGARLDTDLVDQDRAGVPVGLERLRLSPAAIQREHASRVQLLAQGVRFDERLELADGLGAAGRQVRIECELGRVQTQFVEPADLGCGERLVGEVGERLPAPQRKRLPCARFAQRRSNCAASTSPSVSRSS